MPETLLRRLRCARTILINDSRLQICRYVFVVPCLSHYLINDLHRATHGHQLSSYWGVFGIPVCVNWIWSGNDKGIPGLEKVSLFEMKCTWALLHI